MESIAGIVSEYNPLHNGHVYHIGETRRILGDCGVVCIMSGNYVQRGEPAALRKHARAEAAICCGADVVFELPVPFSLSSAETFADRAVGHLAASGVVTHLSFGSECGNTALLERAADVLMSSRYSEELRPYIDRGLPFAEARARAAGKIEPQLRILYDSPNNNLGIEYIKALKSRGLSIKPMTVLRRGAGHDSNEAEQGIASASFIRDLMKQQKETLEYVPEASTKIIRQEIENNRAPAGEVPGMLSYLLRLEKSDFARITDCTEGLEHRIYSALRAGPDINTVLMSVKTKRYAYTRLKRIFMCAYLGIDAAATSSPPCYLRVLAFNERGRMILKKMKKVTDLPVITRPADAKRLLSESAQRMFELECFADDQYMLSLPQPHCCGSGWKTSPFYMKKQPEGL